MILSIDQSLTGTGIAVLYGDGDVDTSFVTTTADMPWFSRMEKIWGAVSQILLDHNDKVCELAVLEDYAYGGSFKGFVLGELGGVLKYELGRLGIPTYQINSAHHKMFVARNGKATKEQTMSGLESRFGIVTDNDNIADAIAMALTASAVVRYKQSNTARTNYDRMVCEKVIHNWGLQDGTIKRTKGRRKSTKGKGAGAEKPTLSREEDPFVVRGLCGNNKRSDKDRR